MIQIMKKKCLKIVCLQQLLIPLKTISEVLASKILLMGSYFLHLFLFWNNFFLSIFIFWTLTRTILIIEQKYTIENSKFCSHGPSSNPKFITFGDLGSISNKYISEFSFRDTVKARIQSDPTGSKHKLSSSCPIRWWYTVLVLLW